MHDRYFARHGDENHRVDHYDLTLDYRIGPNRLDGVARLTLVAVEPLSLLRLDLGAFRVSQVLVDGERVPYTHRENKLTLSAGRPLEPGEAVVAEVRYSGSPRPVRSHWGDLGWEELTDGVIVASQPIGAPSWFPCNDRPGNKASYRISVTAASAYQVIANGRLVSKSRAASGTTWVYEQDEPMATYLASVQIGRYQRAELPGTVPQSLAFPGRLAAQVKHDFGRQEHMLAVFAERFGPYPFDAYNVVVVDDELEIPIEAQGMSIFGRNHVDGRRRSERLVAHELAHQWFGNSLTLADWRDIWLHEGFSAYAEWVWSEASGDEPAGEHARRWHRRLASLPQDLVLADPGPENIFDDRVYKRGALALHALRGTLGDAAFFAMVREWTAAKRYGVVTTREFIGHAQRYAHRPLDTFFWTWLYDARLPYLP
ncbi:putative peptidase M1, membrane alanine aminopeptidase [Planotetraspora thailandica]|uniref:Aminopeptidase N n=1 Tax=Planotetraspora thailandica TaxID=487172 RepID=A0A8J3UWV1_9ACTN|nr:putative peptidase M1, membrane alanine aminopeptidase [Planotetraspora thailandica]